MSEQRDEDAAKIGRIWKNATWLSVVPVMLNVVAIFSTGFITRRLGTEAFGRFSMSTAIIILITGLADFGLRPLAVRDLARAGRGMHRALSDIISLRLLLGIAGTLVVWLIALVIPSTTGLGTVLMVSSLTVVPISAVGVLTDGLIAKDRAKVTSTATLWSGVLLTTASVIAAAVWADAPTMAAAYVVGPMVNMVLLYRASVRTHGPVLFSWRPRKWRLLLSRAFPFFRVGITTMFVGRADTLIVGAMFGDSGAGIYSAAMSLADRLSAIVDSVTTAALPTMMRMRGETERITHVLAQVMHPLINALLVGALMAAWGTSAAVTVVFGAEYAPGGLALAVGLAILPTQALHQLLGEAFIAMRRVQWVTNNGVVGQLVTLVLLAPCAWLLGMPGASLARLIGHMATALPRILEARKTFVGLWGGSYPKRLALDLLWAVPVLLVLMFVTMPALLVVAFSGGAFLLWAAYTAKTSGALGVLRGYLGKR